MNGRLSKIRSVHMYGHGVREIHDFAIYLNIFYKVFTHDVYTKLNCLKKLLLARKYQNLLTFSKPVFRRDLDRPIRVFNIFKCKRVQKSIFFGKFFWGERYDL